MSFLIYDLKNDFCCSKNPKGLREFLDSTS